MVVRKSGRISRKRFLTGAGMALAGAALGCGQGQDVARLIPPYTVEEARDGILAAQPLFAAVGVTSFQDNNVRSSDTIETYLNISNPTTHANADRNDSHRGQGGVRELNRGTWFLFSTPRVSPAARSLDRTPLARAQRSRTRLHPRPPPNLLAFRSR